MTYKVSGTEYSQMPAGSQMDFVPSGEGDTYRYDPELAELLRKTKKDKDVPRVHDMSQYSQEPDEPRGQVGGSHYQLPIEPIDYIVKNDLGFREGNVVKYVTRYKQKNGLEDLLKAQDYLNMLIAEYKNESK